MKKIKDGVREKNEMGEGFAANYNQYIMPLKEKLVCIGVAALAIYGVTFLFYRSHIISLIFCPLALLYPRIRTREIIKRRKYDLSIQFKDMLYSLASSLSAGKSVELAFRSLPEDLSLLYPDGNTDIIREVEYIIRKLDMNGTIESALEDFSDRADIEDIRSFVDVFHICKRSGGNIVEVIKNTSNIISDKIEIKQEINTMLAERKFEQKVLNVLPVFMMILLSVCAGDYIEPVFTTLTGRIAASVSIILLIGAYFISKKIMDINL
ncbi:MAG TPA: pilus assembly protein TadB [Clostridiaceae bacterium]|nr:pilus assembly protein TadB [Clostridiaceae bacterium]